MAATHFAKLATAEQNTVLSAAAINHVFQIEMPTYRKDWCVNT